MNYYSITFANIVFQIPKFRLLQQSNFFQMLATALLLHQPEVLLFDLIVSKFETLWTIWYHLHNLENVKNTHGGALLVIKFTKSNPPLWVFFTFLNYTNGTKLRRASHLYLIQYPMMLFYISLHYKTCIYEVGKFRKVTVETLCKV